MTADAAPYDAFLASKAVTAPPRGFEPAQDLWPQAMKPFQRDIAALSCRRGKSAIFAGTGLGKSIEELAFARQVAEHTQGEVLLFAPLAVAEQIVQVEAPKFGFGNVSYAASSAAIKTPITVTNYERMDHFDLSQFAAVALDESGIIKNHDGATRVALTEGCRAVPYLLCASATPAPNDWTELGQHAEFLDVLSAKEMLATFFVHDGSVRAHDAEDWRLKRHAEDAFWHWMASWSVMIRHPRDLGYDEPGYDLPPLAVEQVTVRSEDAAQDGFLFAFEASTLQERLAARRDSVTQRVKAAADIVASDPNESWLIWCHLNSEAEALCDAIPGAVNVKGADPADYKKQHLLGFGQGRPRILVTKPSIAGRGMNWQNCARMIFVGLNDSFEELFQAIRRCWRFGQMRAVKAFLIASEREGAVLANLQAKERKYERMADAMAAHMKDLTLAHLSRGVPRSSYHPQIAMELPAWLAA